MEDGDRKIILKNLPSLKEGVSFENLFKQLKNKRMFNDYMENEIVNTKEPNRLEFLYKYVTTRGPNAFKELVQALQEIDRKDLAQRLMRFSRPGGARPFLNGTSRPSLEEEFPDNEEWTVVKGDPSDILFRDIEKEYKMESSPRGLALVLNNRKFVNNTHDERHGSEKDVARLKSILPQLGYEVDVKEDLTVNDMVDAVYEFSKDKRHNDYDSAMVFVMSHGTQDPGSSKVTQVIGSDACQVSCDQLISRLSAKLCPYLRRKPKMFFFQLCRGPNFNHTVRVLEQNGGGADHGEEEIPLMRNVDSVEGGVQTDGEFIRFEKVVRSDSDILVGHATSPGMLSMRDPKTGSWYIQTLCRVFARDAWCDDLLTMLQTVKRECNRQELAEEIIIEDTNQGFNKLVFFHPGFRPQGTFKAVNAF